MRFRSLLIFEQNVLTIHFRGVIMVLSSKPVCFFEEAMEIMVRTVNIEPITKEQEFLATPALTKEELTNAFEECLKQVDLNMEYFKDRFPYSCTKGP